eukprot:366235-Chlamydomonas_euryale.AAC.5
MDVRMLWASDLAQALYDTTKGLGTNMLEHERVQAVELRRLQPVCFQRQQARTGRNGMAGRPVWLAGQCGQCGWPAIVADQTRSLPHDPLLVNETFGVALDEQPLQRKPVRGLIQVWHPHVHVPHSGHLLGDLRVLQADDGRKKRWHQNF